MKARRGGSGLGEGQHEQAVVLHLRDFGEADSIVTLYGTTLGKTVAFARAARRSVRRFGGRLVLGARLQCRLRPPRPGAELWTLLDIEQAQLPAWLTVVPPRLIERLLGLYALDLFISCTPEGACDPELTTLLETSRAASRVDEPHAYLTRLHLGLLRYSGLAPRFDYCIACGQPCAADAPVRLVRGDMGVRCLACARRFVLGADEVTTLVPQTRRALQAVGQGGPNAVRDELDATVMRATRWLVEAVFKKNIRSAAVLDEILTKGN
jgi:DNA repair protein RecO (recombination protein O)